MPRGVGFWGAVNYFLVHFWYSGGDWRFFWCWVWEKGGFSSGGWCWVAWGLGEHF